MKQASTIWQGMSARSTVGLKIKSLSVGREVFILVARSQRGVVDGDDNVVSFSFGIERNRKGATVARVDHCDGVREIQQEAFGAHDVGAVG